MPEKDKELEKLLVELVNNNGGIHPEPVGIDYAISVILQKYVKIDEIKKHAKEENNEQKLF